ncbi:hypothetical protein FOCC_FOCC012220 [Frankliniella occidentalis]|nr:hypothetical protein FOCC_FOCC012220 [Frankliniella occidentalis]
MVDVLKGLLQTTEEDKKVKSVLQRLYIQSSSERDFSAQETCHLLMGLNLTKTDNRNFVTLNFNSYKRYVQVSENSRQKKHSIDRYCERKDTFEDKCLWYMIKNYNLSTLKKYKKEAIVQIYPKLKFNANQDANNEEFFRQQVLLYVPWRNEQQFLQQGKPWQDIFTDNEGTISTNKQHETDLTEMTPEETEFEADQEDEDDFYSAEEWMCISNMGPNQNVTEVELGRRDVDINHNWHAALSSYEKYGTLPELKSFLKVKKETDNTPPSAVPYPSVDFTAEQASISKLVDMQIESIINPEFKPNFQIPQRIIIQGKAGTGKSLVVQAMKHKIINAFGHEGFLLITPTGVSAKSVEGSTIHSSLHINPKQKEFLPLKGPAAHALEEKLRKTHFIIMDEFSMVGCQLMQMIEERITQGKGNDTADFGNLFVFILGDARQLPPIGYSPVYSDNINSPERLRGKLIYDNFQGAVVLNQVLRQNDAVFQNVLHNISVGAVNREDYNVLKTRFATNISPTERETFKDAIHLYPTTLQVLKHNKEKLISMKTTNGQQQPIARIPALHNCNAAARGTRDDAEGLFPVLHLAKGAKIMLKSNLWTEKGLVNGAMGEIVDILYREDANPQIDPPDVLICKFDSYTGPYLDNDLKTVPIQSLTKSWTSKAGDACTRTQFPITLSFACSIHQSQGLTLQKAVIDIGLKEMSPGITYVALSRVKTLSGIMLHSFPFQRIHLLNSKDSIKRRNEWIAQLEAINITKAFT